MKADVLVIGAGIAGLTTAINCAEAGYQVILISKAKQLSESNSSYAQGGIVYNKKETSPEALIKDILRAGGPLVKKESASIVARDGASVIENLLIKKAKVPFTKNKFGFQLTKEAAHSHRRILFAYDTTGKYIIEGLLNYIKQIKNIKILSEHMAIDILTREHNTNDIHSVYMKPEALGAYVYNLRSNKVKKILAHVTVLATGGIGQIYKHTTNPKIATGDGIAMAYRAGAKIINMEYTQFHPTTLFGHSAQNFLISESVRGEGAVLINQDGKEFIKHHKGSLAPRDIVSIAIHNELIQSHKEFVYLDLSKIQKLNIKKRFPGIYNKCLKYNIDIEKDLIPVVPAFHFSCGGIFVDSWGRSTIQNLFVAGESSCTGLHGANRLASTSLLEGVVWGDRISKYIKKYNKKYFEKKFPVVRDWESKGVRDKEVDPALLKQDWETLKNTMWNYVGVVRTKNRLQRAQRDLTNLRSSIETFYRNTILSADIIELRNAVQVGLIIANAAWQNKTSRGGHYRLN